MSYLKKINELGDYEESRPDTDPIRVEGEVGTETTNRNGE